MKHSIKLIIYFVLGCVLLQVKALPAETKSLHVDKIVADSDDIFFSSHVSDVYVDTTVGRVIVTDTDGCNIKSFDMEGKLLHQFGRKGQGPGDLNGPTVVYRWGESYWVAEPMNRRIQIFDKNWNSIKTIRTPSLGIADFIPSDDGGLWGVPNKGFQVHIFIDKKKESQSVLFKMGTDGKLLQTLGSSPVDKNFYLTEMMRNVVLLPGPEKSLYVIYTILNKIEIYKNNTLFTTFHMPLPFTPVKPKATMKREGNTFLMHLEMDRILSDACWSPSNELYVALYQSNTSKGRSNQHLCKIDHKTGKVLDEWSLPEQVTAFDFLGKNRVVILTENEDGEFALNFCTLN